VALSYKDVMALRPGEILIAEDVGPAWAPLLSLAGGIVMARGDLLSPGAVAARDYGIPCVYGASGVTSAVRTGQIVRVDGSSGAVVKVTGR
jgi:pyruvate,water dikinase